MTSKTPKTDAATKCRDTSGQNASVYRYVYEVPAEFAKELELENNAMRNGPSRQISKIECGKLPSYDT